MPSTRDGTLEGATRPVYMGRFDTIADLILASDADIVCLQEVWFSPDILNYMQTKLGAKYGPLPWRMGATRWPCTYQTHGCTMCPYRLRYDRHLLKRTRTKEDGIAVLVSKRLG